MDLTVRGKVFKIDFVSNYVHEKYQELIELATSIVDEVKIKDLIELAKTDKKKATEGFKEVEAKRKDISSKIILLRRDMLREIVQSNDPNNPSAYDADWWQKKTDPDDINDFLLSCLQKDKITSKGVKKN